MDGVNVEAVHAVMAAARECAMQMFQNAMFIQGELPGVEMPDELRARTERVCSGLISTKHDLISELAELDELLGTGDSETDVGSRVKRIVTWMGLDIMQIHELVSALHAASRENPDYGAAFTLVAESGANIMSAFSATAETANKVSQ